MCNIIEPLLSKDFIYDSFANQTGKGTHKAIKRFKHFIRKMYTESNIVRGGQSKLFEVGSAGYALKADIRHYFDTIDHEVLLQIITRKIKDKHVILLIKIILENHKSDIPGKGMPIGNLTSQFFANVYLNELDWFVKHTLKVKYYIRYVDDFVILHRDKQILEEWKEQIDIFMKSTLRVNLHPEKTSIIPLGKGITFLGFRVFHNSILLKKSNVRRIWRRLGKLKQKYDKGGMSMEEARCSLEGWLAYAEFANTYNLRSKVLLRFYELFSHKF